MMLKTDIVKLFIKTVPFSILVFGCISFSARDLHDASMKNDVARVSALINNGSKIDESIDSCGRFVYSYTEFYGRNCQTTALMMASMFGHYSTAKMLLENGANIEKEDAWNNTAIFYALESIVRKKHQRIVYNLNPEKIKEPSIQEITDLVRLLIKNGANLNKENIMGLTPLMLAKIGGSPEIEKLLCENGAGLPNQIKAPSLNLGNSLNLYVTLDGKKIIFPVSAKIRSTDTPQNYVIYPGEHEVEIEYFFESAPQYKQIGSTHGEKIQKKFQAKIGYFYNISSKVDFNNKKWDAWINEYKVNCE